MAADPFAHDPVRRRAVAGAQFDPISGLERLSRDDLDRAAAKASRCRLREPPEGADRLARADQAALLKDMSENHHDRDERRRRQIADRKGGRHRERDEEIRDAMQRGGLKAPPRRRHDRPGDEDRRRAGDQRGQRRVAAGTPIPSPTRG